jgi:hypothetical protein
MGLAIYLSTSADGQARRNIFPGLVSLAAAYTFLSHPSKHTPLLSALHRFIGFLNAGIGGCRILDVVFVSYSAYPMSTSRAQYISHSDSLNSAGIGLRGPWNAFASFLGIIAGIVTMLANEEQAVLLEKWDFEAPVVVMGAAVVGVGVVGCE